MPEYLETEIVEKMNISTPADGRQRHIESGPSETFLARAA